MRDIVIILVSFIVGALITLIILLSLSPFLEFISFINSGKKWDYDPIALQSINVGILQAILGIGAIVAALLVFINFNSTKEKLEKMDANVIEMRRIVDRHNKQIKEEFEKDSKRNVPNIDTSNDNTSEEVDNL